MSYIRPRPTSRELRHYKLPACARQRQRATCCKRKAGKPAPAGKQPTTAPGRNSPVTQAGTGRMAGSSTRRGHETSINAIACCCRLCSLPPKPCYARRADRTRVPGSRQCQAKQLSLSLHRPCSSRCGVACVCPCRSAPIAAARALVAANRSTSMGTTPWPAPAQGWHDDRRASLGARSPRGGRTRGAGHPPTVAGAHYCTGSAGR